MRTLPALLLSLLTALPLAAIAGNGAPSCQPVVTGGWVRMAPGMPMGAAFAVIRNPCPRPTVLVDAASPAFGDVSLHETRIDRGMSRMRAVQRVPLKPAGVLELKPGGLHVMLMQPRTSVAPGDRVRVEFVFADGRRVAADLPVRAAAP